jgi:hypothetical protein
MYTAPDLVVDVILEAALSSIGDRIVADRAANN